MKAETICFCSVCCVAAHACVDTSAIGVDAILPLERRPKAWRVVVVRMETNCTLRLHKIVKIVLLDTLILAFPFPLAGLGFRTLELQEALSVLWTLCRRPSETVETATSPVLSAGPRNPSEGLRVHLPALEERLRN